MSVSQQCIPSEKGRNCEKPQKGEEKPRGDPGTQVHYQLTVIIAQTDTHKHKFSALTQSEKDYMAILLVIFSHCILSAQICAEG